MSFLLVLIASLLGSPHCGAMCGGFVAISSHSTDSFKSQTIYHAGRLCTYLLLGFVAGTFGSLIDSLGFQAGISRAAALITGGLLIFSGLSTLLGWRPWVSRIISRILPAHLLLTLRQKLTPNRSQKFLFPFSLGFFSTLLPCGWLYTYVAVAAGTAHSLSALGVMFFFWLGTLPLLIAVGSLSELISTPFKKYIPKTISVLMIAAGSYSMAGHLGWIAMNHDHHQHGDHLHHK